jgi:hypothetical protein
VDSITYIDTSSSRGTVSQFIEERRFLKNVAPKWCQDAFKAFQGALESEATQLADKRAVSVGHHCKTIAAIRDLANSSETWE